LRYRRVMDARLLSASRRYFTISVSRSRVPESEADGEGNPNRPEVRQGGPGRGCLPGAAGVAGRPEGEPKQPGDFQAGDSGRPQLPRPLRPGEQTRQEARLHRDQLQTGPGLQTRPQLLRAGIILMQRFAT